MNPDTPKPNEQEAPIQADFSGPDTQSWYDYIWKTEQETPKRLEDAAKFLAGTIAVCITIIVKIKYPSEGLSAPAFGACLSWVFALIIACLVINPRSYKYQKGSLANYKATHQKIVTYKRNRLYVSSLLFLIGLLFLVATLFWSGVFPAQN